MKQQFYDVRFQHDYVTEDGCNKRMTSNVVVFAHDIPTAVEEVAAYAEEFGLKKVDLQAVKKSNLKVVYGADKMSDKFVEVEVLFTDLTERGGEKKVKEKILVAADTIEAAKQVALKEYELICGLEIVSLKQSNVNGALGSI